MSLGPAAALPEDVRAARGYLEVARADCRKGFDLSACLTAEKAAEVALQAYARAVGLDAGVDSLPGLLAALPGARTRELDRAAAELEPFRMDLSSAHRSPGHLPDTTPETAEACCAAAATVVTRVEDLLRALAEESG